VTVLKLSRYLATIAPIFLIGCADENHRATATAERAMVARNGRLLLTAPMDERSCYIGCLTQICAAFEIRDKNDRVTDVVFLRVEGMDDTKMTIMEEYRSLAECKADWDHG